MKFSPLVERISGEAAAAWDLHSRATQAALHDPDVIVLSVGDPDLDTPQPIIDSLVKSVNEGRTHYSSTLGELKLRKAVASYYKKRGHTQVKYQNIAIVPGTQSGLFATAMCLLSAGDEVIIPEPMYVTYPGFVGAAGATIVPVSLEAESGFSLNVNTVADAMTPKTRAIVLNSPNNPTGAVITYKALEKIAQLCQTHDLWLISDEVYLDIYFEAAPTSALGFEQIADRAVVVSSLSKSHAMTGWRSGWIVAPESLVAHLYNLLNAMLYGAPTFIQDAAITALAQPQLVDTMREVYRARRDSFCKQVSTLPKVSALRPEGGMFVMLDVRETGLSAHDFATRFFEEEKVSLLAADAFGPSAKGYLRVGLTVDEVKLGEACRRLERFLKGLS